MSTAAALPVPTGLPVTTANVSTLANQLSYARSFKTTRYKTKCTKKTGTIYLPSSSVTLDSSEGAGSGSSGSGNSSPDSVVPADSSASGGTPSESNESGESDYSALASGQSGSGSGGVCGPQQTVTVRAQTTVTVTQVAEAAGSVAASDGSTNTSDGVPAQEKEATVSSGRKTPVEDASSISLPTSASSAIASPLLSGSSNSGSGSDFHSNATLPGSASPSGTGYPITPASVSSYTGNSDTPESFSDMTNSTTSTNLNGQFWAGATISTLMRMEAIPQRIFYAEDGQAVQDPIQTLANAGVNAFRVATSRGQCLGPTQFVNNASTLGEELTFTLDWGCIDIQVQTAQRGVARDMRVVLTINQGFDIPAGMESYTYEQMISEVKNEAKRQIQPFLNARIVPDVILFENEGSDGFLFTDQTTGHVRGSDDGKAPKAQVDKEKCGEIPTGNMVSFPQYTGYLKAELLACNEAISAAGFSSAGVRYGLHSHGQYVQWKESTLHGPNQLSQTELTDASGNTCSNFVIPAAILWANASEMITVMGFSAYPDPMTPTDINSLSSEHDTFNRTLTTLTELMSYAEAYGKYVDGPFAGEYKLQSLGVEYGTAYSYDQVSQEQSETSLMWSLVKQFPNVLGMLWYEPWYCHADWEGGKAALCHNIDTKNISGQAPTVTLNTWGAAAISPWKK